MSSSEPLKILKAACFALALPLSGASPGVVLAQQTADADTSSTRSESLESLQTKMSRSRWTRWMTDYIFLGRVQGDSAAALPFPVVEIESPYLPYRGRFIRRIDTARLPVFNTETSAPHWVLSVGNAIHIGTRERIIRNYLLMEEGTPLDPYILADTERILRSSPFLEDATIVVIPVAETADSVDLLVVTQDAWSLGVTGSVASPERYKVKLFDRNFLGFGHLIEAAFDVNRGRSQEVDFAGLYGVGNIWGSFIDSELRYIDSHMENRRQVVFSRPFRAVEINYGGALSVSRVGDKDASAAVRTEYDQQDLWIGRAFRSHRAGAEEDRRKQLTVSGRVAVRDYVKRGPVAEDTDRSLHNRTLTLAGVSWSHSAYRKALLLRTYGNTDDISYGYLASVVGGYEAGEFNDRWYAGARVSLGGFGKTYSYLTGLVEAGSFFRGSDAQDAAVRVSVSGFSGLSPPGRYRYRCFYGVDYLAGFDRQSNDRLKLRVEAIDTNLEDTQRLTLGLEPVVFTPWRVFGFRFAVFGSFSAGNIGPDPDSFLQGKYYSSFGAGLRFHNDHLVFGSYELKLFYVPNVPPDASASVFDFSTVREVSGGDFTPGPPSTVGFN
jgi:hypothetical protein